MTEQLVSATHGQNCGTFGDRRGQRLALGAGEVGEDPRLVAILAAAHEQQVTTTQVGGTGTDGQHLDVDPPPPRPTLEGTHVADVAVDVHRLRVEMADAQRPAHERPPAPSGAAQ